MGAHLEIENIEAILHGQFTQRKYSASVKIEDKLLTSSDECLLQARLQT